MLVSGSNLDSGVLYDFILSYYEMMKGFDSDFHWKRVDWWKEEEESKVIISGELKAGRLNGFMIIGYGGYVDSDVSSEICEVYSVGGLTIFFDLLEEAQKYFLEPWGFQVLESNDRANRFFAYLLNKKNYVWTRELGKDGNTSVLKSRIHSQENWIKTMAS